MNILKLKNNETKLPIFSWCKDLEDEALEQAMNLANHPVIAKHVALMPDCYQGYGMLIGGVKAQRDLVKIVTKLSTLAVLKG